MSAQILLWPGAPRASCFDPAPQSPDIWSGGPGDPFHIPPEDDDGREHRPARLSDALPCWRLIIGFYLAALALGAGAAWFLARSGGLV